MPDYVNITISGTSQQLRSTRYQVSGRKKDRERKKTKEIKIETWNINKRTRSGSRPSFEGTSLLFAGGTVSPMMCPSDGQQKNDEKGQMEDKTRWEQRPSRKKQKKTATRWDVFVEFVFSWCFEEIRRDTSYRDIYRVIISQMMRYHKIRDFSCIHIPSFWDWYRDIVCRRYISR